MIALALGGCASKNDTYVERPVETIYNIAMDQLLSGDYKQAAATFDEVERQHPYSVWATKAQLMNAYALYENKDYDASIVSADRFIQLHPGHRDVAYAYYLKALDYYIQITDVERDQKVTQQAYDALSEVVRRFPDSTYARDAKFKMDLAATISPARRCRSAAAGEGQGEYLAAINRFQDGGQHLSGRRPTCPRRWRVWSNAIMRARPQRGSQAHRLRARLQLSERQNGVRVDLFTHHYRFEASAKPEDRGWIAKVVDPFGIFWIRLLPSTQEPVVILSTIKYADNHDFVAFDLKRDRDPPLETKNQPGANIIARHTPGCGKTDSAVQASSICAI